MERRARLIEKDDGPDRPAGARALCEALAALRPSIDFAFEEPSDLDAIRAHRPPGPRAIAAPQPDDVLADRTLGAWLGRAAGCMLGKPVEGWSRDKIADLMKLTGQEELTDYFLPPGEGSGELDISEWCRGATQGHITHALRDDDMDYTIIGLRILEQHGREFTPRQVAEFWLHNIPWGCTYTAERVAYRNFVNGIWPPDSASERNPCREWIGAQIRADAFGYACPGRPEEAAGLAFKDASISHVKNGIYGELWVAAMLAAAFVADEPAKVIEIGLSEVPRNCRLSAAIATVVGWHAEGVPADEAVGRILAEFGHYHRVHTINNAAIVAMALLWGQKDFSRTLGLAVSAGLDTDCNGATVGSVMGAILGAQAIPEHWTAPLNDRIETIVTGESGLTLTGLAERTRRVQQG